MSDVSRTGKTFKLSKPFAIDDHLQNSIGIYGADSTELVHLHFSAAIATLVAERRWHHTQIIDTQPDGSAHLRMEVAVTPELERWVLGWGADVEVLAPLSLRQEMAEVGRVLASRA